MTEPTFCPFAPECYDFDDYCYGDVCELLAAVRTQNSLFRRSEIEWWRLMNGARRPLSNPDSPVGYPGDDDGGPLS